MAVSPQDIILDRIKSATRDSRIAIFLYRRGRVKNFDAVFADTIVTIKRLKRGDGNHIGSFYGTNGANKAAKLMREI